MSLDKELLGKLLCERLCTKIRIHKRDDEAYMLESPFSFPDGDQIPIYLAETTRGGVMLSDRGHTLMHISYENDIDAFSEGARAVLWEQIVRECEIQEEEGVFKVETSPEQIVETLFRFGQALTKIYDLTFLSRDRIATTFYEDLKSLLFGIVGEERLELDHTPVDVPHASNYPVDYHLKGRDGSPLFIYGIPNRDKARLTTIMLSHFLLHKLTFESIIVFLNQQEIPRLDVARLTNVAGTAVASLEAEQDFRRKIAKLAA